MKQLSIPSKYTIAEFIQAMEHAKRLGFSYVKLGDFEATCDIEDAPKVVPPVGAPLNANTGNPTRGKNPDCPHCASEMRPSNQGGLYCHSCWVRKKEDRWQKGNRNAY